MPLSDRDQAYYKNRKKQEAKEQRAQQRREDNAYNNKASRDERDYETSYDRRNKETTSDKKAYRDERSFRDTDLKNQRARREASDRNNKASRDERQYDNMTRQKKEMDQRIKDAHGSSVWGVKSKTPGSYDSNPTASGEGRGGKRDREWKNHKWSTRERNEAGKWIYDYGDTTSGGNNAKTSQKARDKATLNITAKKATTRNTGRDVSKDPIERAMNEVTKAASSFSDNAGKVISDGANFVSNMVSDFIGDTPLKNLFK